MKTVLLLAVALALGGAALAPVAAANEQPDCRPFCEGADGLIEDVQEGPEPTSCRPYCFFLD